MAFLSKMRKTISNFFIAKEGVQNCTAVLFSSIKENVRIPKTARIKIFASMTMILLVIEGYCFLIPGNQQRDYLHFRGDYRCTTLSSSQKLKEVQGRAVVMEPERRGGCGLKFDICV